MVQGHVNVEQWVLEILKKYKLFANLKKCCFNPNEIRFLSFIVSDQKIQIKEEKIKAIKNWLKQKSFQDIQVSIRFAILYQRFIKGFSKITISLILILKTSANHPKSRNINNNGARK